MSKPVCRECDACKAEPFVDEFTEAEYWDFGCADCNNRFIGVGYDASDALPKTCPRWCPRREKGGADHD